jgi:hypothetical protein
MKPFSKFAAGVAAAALASAFSSTSRADGPVIIQNPPPQQVVVEQPAEGGTVYTYTGPNRAMLSSGLVTFGISYGVGVVVASESNHYGDTHLFVPIVGPWIDMADRGSCGPATSAACDNETANKVGLAVDGVFQAIGALSVIASCLYPEEDHRVAGVVVGKAAPPPKPEIHVTPTGGRNGTGLAVFGTF